MSGIALYEHARSLHVHGDPGGERTLCGLYCGTKAWRLLTTFGSLYDITCPNCIRALKASGDRADA